MTDGNSNPDATRIDRRIAIVAVHGVGDQLPMASARAIGDLLQNLNVNGDANGNSDSSCADPPRSEHPKYDPFLERTLRVNVRPVVIHREESSWGDGARGPFHEWVTAQRKTEGTRRSKTAVDAERYDADISMQFMRGQLRCYHGDTPEDTYETIRLEGVRRPENRPAEMVHIYELYWADLSRLKNSLLRIIAELYQILLHLPSLGTHVVDAESLHHDHPSWTCFRATHSWAALSLSMAIPLINLFMLGNALAIGGYLELSRFSQGYHVAVPAAILAIVLTVLMGRPLWKSNEMTVSVWIFPVVFLLAALGVISWTVRGCGGFALTNPASACGTYARSGRALALVELLGLAAGLITYVVVAYDRMRPGFARWAKWLATVIVPVIAASLMVTYFSSGGYGKQYAGFDGLLILFRAFECLYIAVMAAWGALAVTTALSWAAGAWALRHVDSTIADDRPSRGRWTARLTLSVATFAFASVSLITWGLINHGIALLVKPEIPYVPLLMFAEHTARNLSFFMDNVTSYGGFSALLVFLSAGLVAALPALWGLAPVVWPEVRPPSYAKAQGPYASRLGRWLTLAFRGLRISGRVLYLTTTVAAPLVVALIVLPALFNKPLPWDLRFLLRPLQILGGASGVLIIGLFTMRGQLMKGLRGFRTTLDVMLDVDSWLREHPRDSNPKARICGRYVSLLRYICDWRDPLDRTRQYDTVVFVAHSQGTVITADLLRFLKSESHGDMRAYDAPLVALERPDLNVALFTMGCPLRDLYGLRFPRLYNWARHSDTATMSVPPPPDLPAQRRPAPSELYALKKWVNAYRSGDYIGRFLWRNGACSYSWTPEIASVDDGKREEFCIGAGAHTHYWDHTAPPIADRIDKFLD